MYHRPNEYSQRRKVLNEFYINFVTIQYITTICIDNCCMEIDSEGMRRVKCLII